jgi:hypothetical protein
MMVGKWHTLLSFPTTNFIWSYAAVDANNERAAASSCAIEICTNKLRSFRSSFI